MFIELTITWVPSGFSGYIWLDTKIVLKTKQVLSVQEPTGAEVQERPGSIPSILFCF